MKTIRRALPLLLLLPLLPLVLSGCARAQARTVPDGPALDMPAPPPREVAALEIDDAPPPEPPDEPAPTPPAPPRPAAPRPEPAKPDPVASEPPAPAPEAPRPPTTLQTTPAGSEGELERAIRESLRRAAADLARIDYQRLNPDARSQYDTAKRFSQQAEEALRGKNLLFGKNLADKAASLAAQLAGR